MTSENGWYPVLPEDFAAFHRIAATIHPEMYERPAVTEEKLTLFSQGCRKLLVNSSVVGYGISHPWLKYSIPPLNTFLTALPVRPNCLYLHDVAILASGRCTGALASYVDCLQQIVAELNLSALALVSVYGTGDLWRRFVFEAAEEVTLHEKLASYGATAKYMIRNFA